MLAWVQEGTSWLKAWNCLSNPVSQIRAADSVLGEMPPAHLNFFALLEDLKILFLTTSSMQF